MTNTTKEYHIRQFAFQNGYTLVDHGSELQVHTGNKRESLRFYFGKKPMTYSRDMMKSFIAFMNY